MPQILHCRKEVMYTKTGRIVALQANLKHKEHAKGMRKLKQKIFSRVSLILSHLVMCELKGNRLGIPQTVLSISND